MNVRKVTGCDAARPGACGGPSLARHKIISLAVSIAPAPLPRLKNMSAAFATISLSASNSVVASGGSITMLG